VEQALQQEHILDARGQSGSRSTGAPSIPPPAVITLPTRDDVSRLPPISDLMDALDDSLRNGRYGPWPVRSTCDGAGFAVTTCRDGNHGECEFIRLGDGAWLTSGTMSVAKPVAIWSRNKGGIAIDVAVRGGWQLSYTGALHNQVTVSSGYGSVSILSRECVCRWLPFVGIPNEYVSLLFRDEPEMRAFGLKSSELAAVLGELTVRQASRSRTYVIEPGSDMHNAARAVRQTQLTGASRLLYMKAKSYELLANLATCQRVANPRPESQVRPAVDDASVAALAVSAMGNCTTAVDVRALARQLDITENRLVRAFKSTYGTTPFGYANRARVARGREMLREGHMSLIDIALACGYEHHSSFTTAYRRTYGETPRETRLRARRISHQRADSRSARAAFNEIHAFGQLA
jgi:AraC-like DNA-binding protein